MCFIQYSISLLVAVPVVTKAAIYCNNYPCILQQNLFINAISLPFLPSLSLPSRFRSLQEDGWNAPSCWLIAQRRRKKVDACKVPLLGSFFDCKEVIKHSDKVERRRAISNSPP